MHNWGKYWSMLAVQRGRPRSQPQCVTEFMDRQCMYDLMLCPSVSLHAPLVVTCCMCVVSFTLKLLCNFSVVYLAITLYFWSMRLASLDVIQSNQSVTSMFSFRLVRSVWLVLHLMLSSCALCMWYVITQSTATVKVCFNILWLEVYLVRLTVPENGH